MAIFTADQVKEHNSSDDAWIIVYDVTNFLSEHPGGKKVLLKMAGKDATKQFNQFHNQAIMEKFGPKLLKGDLAGAKL